VFFLCGCLSAFASNPDKASEILNQTFDLNRSVKRISVTMLMKERIKGDYIKKKSDFKVIFDPYQVYIKQYYPNKGLEVLYSNQHTAGKAFVNRNTIAFPVLRLDPLGNAMRKENHHSIFKAGFSFLVSVLERLHKKYEDVGIPVWHYDGIVKYADIICYKITFNSPDFHYKDYTIREGENLEIISKKLMINDYMIFEINPELSSLDNLKPGSKIKIPSDYGKQIIVYIDKSTLAPVGLKVFDNIGLFEEYTYLQSDINPDFTSKDFDSSNPNYGFR
jgi:outer membrane lipoprotein-sorting protein